LLHDENQNSVVNLGATLLIHYLLFLKGQYLHRFHLLQKDELNMAQNKAPKIELS